MSDRFNDRFKFRMWHEEKSEMIELGICPQCNKCSPHNPVNLEECNIMQCTGLKDKNGTLIYEGDIVKVIPEEDNAIIEWHNNTARYITRLIEQKAYLGFDGYDDYEDVCGTEFEVIGNKYENPELLEAGNENS